MDLGLKGRVAIVTGSGRGIGAETVRAFAEEGVKVVVTDIDADVAAKVASELSDDGFEVIAVPADVTNKEQVQALVGRTVDKFGTVDILVNNAGFAKDSYLTKMDEGDWDAVIDTILKGAYFCTKAAAEHMIEQKSGKIVNMSSRAHLGNPGQANYSSAKAGIIGFTRSLSLEMGKFNINVNAVAPGLTETGGLKSHPNYDQIKENAIANTPLPRVGYPRDIANAILFLSSDAASYITGDVIHVTGGRYS